LLIAGLLVSFGLGVLVGRKASPATPDLFEDEEADTDPRVLASHKAVRERTEKRLARILAKAKAEGRITNDGAEELFCISDRTASVYLGELTKRGDLERKGAGRGTHYTPK
jgi:predicted HTH transcriptional regulator